MAWRSVKRGRPCELCGRPDHCSYSDDDTAFICRKVEDPARRPLARRDRVGCHYFLYIKDRKKVREVLADEPSPRPNNHRYEAADADTLDAVYREFLQQLPALECGHHLDLTKRGYTNSEIERIGFRSWPRSSAQFTEIGRNLAKKFKEALLTVPGFYAVMRVEERCECKGECPTDPPCLKVKTNVPRLGIALNGCAGYALPILDDHGRIVAIQLRQEEDTDGSRYLLFSCSEFLSCGGPLAVHVPDVRGLDVDASEVWLTEGVHKCELATRRMKKRVLGLPFVGAGALAFPTLEALQPKRVVLAFDADARTNPLVAGPLRWTAQSLAEQGYSVALATWTIDHGKGIDDVLAGDHRKHVKIAEGIEMWRTIVDLSRAAKAPEDPLLAARITVYGLSDRSKRDASVAFRAGVVAASARLARNGAEGEHFLAEMKDALPGRFTAWTKAVDAASRKLVREERENAAKDAGKVLLRRGDHAELAGVVAQELSTEFSYFDTERRARMVRTIAPVATEGTLYQYDEQTGIWAERDHARLSCEVQSLSGSSIGGEKELHVFGGTVEGTIKCLHAKCAGPGFFDRARRGVAFENGFVELSGDGPVVRQHHPDQRARFAHDFDFVMGAKPRRFLGLLERAFKGEADADAKIALIQEFIGAARFGLGTTYQKVLLFFGPFANDGKTTIASILARTMPPGACSNVRPDAMSERFQLAPLVGALFNYVDEVGTKPIDRAEVFKQVVTAKSPMLVEKKGVDPFMAKIIAAHLVLGNHFPLADDPSDGFLRRFTIIGFSRPVEKVVVGIEEEILKEEGAEIVSWSVEGAARLVRQGHYTEPASAQALLDEWRKKANPVLAFVADMLVPTSDKKKMSKLCELYTLYGEYARAKGHKVMAENTFGSRLRQWRVEDETGNFYALMPREEVLREEKQRRAEREADEVFAKEYPVTPLDPDEERADDEHCRSVAARHANADDRLN